MSRLRSAALALFVALAIRGTAAATPEGSQQHMRAVLRSLSWRTGTVSLAPSNATFSVPSGDRIVTGAGARAADEAVNGVDESNTEAYVETATGVLYLSYHGSGYVTTDDVSKIDPDSMLADVKSSVESANAEREKHGYPRIHVDGWVAKPVFSQATDAARFVLGFHDDGGHGFVNAVALVLGRHGYERFTYATDPGDEGAIDRRLDGFVHDYHYDKGSRFGDSVSGDKLAGFGIAALVGTAAGVTIAKTVGFGAILLALKKFVLLGIAGLVALFRRFRGGTSGKQARQPPAPRESGS